MSVKLLSKENEQLIFHTEEIADLLAPYADHKIAVISIAGTFRTGKSFLANWLIRYFQQGRSVNWLEDDAFLDKELDGFTFERQREPVTDGIEVWGEVFETEHSHLGKVAVLIMDTQGIFSMGCDLAESVAVFAVSLFLSSVQIYNIRGNLTRSDLEHLQLFASYGSMLNQANEGTNCCPFQRLIFAIRDWDLDDELGLEAGTKFLQSVMDEMAASEEGEDVLNSIRTSFRFCI